MASGASSTNGSTRSVEQIEADIARTREELSETLGVLADKVNPRLQAARAADRPCFDGVFNRLKDEAGLSEQCEEGRRFGFDGKSLIHPDQIEPCNRLFAPSAEDVARAQRLVDAFGGGAERFEDELNGAA